MHSRNLFVSFSTNSSDKDSCLQEEPTVDPLRKDNIYSVNVGERERKEIKKMKKQANVVQLNKDMRK